MKNRKQSKKTKIEFIPSAKFDILGSIYTGLLVML